VKYLVRLADREVELQLDGDSVRFDDGQLQAHATEIEGTPVRLVTIGDRVHRVVVRRGRRRGEYVLSVGGFRLSVEALDERTRTIRELAAAAAPPAGPAPLVAPMPGLIVRIAVSEGDLVQAGQGLVVMEAMKMENELRATSDGTVKRVHVAPGVAVEKGALLLELA
jgi:biotin carboxyl carrier protein